MMLITVDNGWRGSIPGIARVAAISSSGDDVTVIIPRAALLRQPKAGGAFAYEKGELQVDAVTASSDRQNIILSCRRTNNG